MSVRTSPLYVHLGIINQHDISRYAERNGAGPAVYIDYRAHERAAR